DVDAAGQGHGDGAADAANGREPVQGRLHLRRRRVGGERASGLAFERERDRAGGAGDGDRLLGHGVAPAILHGGRGGRWAAGGHVRLVDARQGAAEDYREDVAGLRDVDGAADAADGREGVQRRLHLRRGGVDGQVRRRRPVEGQGKVAERAVGG